MPLFTTLLLGLVSSDPLQPIGKLSDPSIRETSGIVASRTHRGVFWILSDSGNPAAVHAIKSDGTVLATVRVAVPNVDWEDIATDSAGHLYLGEIGNNRTLVPVRAVYRIDEPDPARPPDRPVPVTLASYYGFAGPADRFDAESLMIVGDDAWIITKRFDGREAELHAIGLAPAAPLLRPGRPRRLGVVPGFTEPATGADLSADGLRLAVVSLAVVRVYDRDRATGRLTRVAEVRYPSRHLESIGWDGLDLILVTEPGELFRLPATTWKR